jgi:hypothetical protein
MHSNLLKILKNWQDRIKRRACYAPLIGTMFYYNISVTAFGIALSKYGHGRFLRDS